MMLFFSTAFAGPKESVIIQHENSLITSVYAWYDGFSNRRHRYKIYEDFKIKYTILCKDALCVERKPSYEDGIKTLSLSPEEIMAIKSEWIRFNSDKNSDCRRQSEMNEVKRGK